MGRIKTKLTKRITMDFMEAYGEKVTTDFTENKTLVNEKTNVCSTRLRNNIAGYATRLKKAEGKSARTRA